MARFKVMRVEDVLKHLEQHEVRSGHSVVEIHMHPGDYYDVYRHGFDVLKVLIPMAPLVSRRQAGLQAEVLLPKCAQLGWWNAGRRRGTGNHPMIRTFKTGQGGPPSGTVVWVHRDPLLGVGAPDSAEVVPHRLFP